MFVVLLLLIGFISVQCSILDRVNVGEGDFGSLKESIILEKKINFLVRQFKNNKNLLNEIKSSFPQAPNLLKDNNDNDNPLLSNPSVTAKYPIVFTHGMGDSCFNAGMASLPTLAASYLNTYAVCIPGGDDVLSDTLSAFLTTMNANVDIFAKKVKADAKLANGFYAVGLSQGNLVIRGYMQKYNNPTVIRSLHVHGTMMGVAAFPHCPNSVSLCQGISSLLGSLAYNSLVQSILFQANYFRDPLLVNSTNYQTTSQIGEWNGEGKSVNPSYRSNFILTTQVTTIKALGDNMIDPKESEWWGSYQVGSFAVVKPMEQNDYYINDTFGLKTLNENKRLFFNTSTGDHLQFSSSDLESWMLQAGFASD